MSELVRHARDAIAVGAIACAAIFGTGGQTAAFEVVPHHQESAQEYHMSSKATQEVIQAAAENIARIAITEDATGSHYWTKPVEAQRGEWAISRICPIGRIFMTFKGTKGPLKAPQVEAVTVEPGQDGIDGEIDLTTIHGNGYGGSHHEWIAEWVDSSADLSTLRGHYPHMTRLKAAQTIVKQAQAESNKINNGCTIISMIQSMP